MHRSCSGLRGTTGSWTLVLPPGQVDFKVRAVHNAAQVPTLIADFLLYAPLLDLTLFTGQLDVLSAKRPAKSSTGLLRMQIQLSWMPSTTQTAVLTGVCSLLAWTTIPSVAESAMLQFCQGWNPSG